MSELVEKELVPELRFPEFKNVGEWVERKLGEIISFSSGGTPSKNVPEYWGGEIPWISASSMHHTRINQSDHNITQFAVDKGARIVPKGTLLLLVRGSMLHKRIPIGITELDVAFNQDVKALNPKSDTLESFLLCLLVASEQRLLGAVTKTGIGAGKLDTSDLKDFLVYIPLADEEQQKIADCLLSVDSLITAKVQKYKSLKAHKKGLTQQLFPTNGEMVPKLRFPDFQGIEDWAEIKLLDRIQLISGMHLSPKEYTTSGKVPYFTGPSDFTNIDSDVGKWTSKKSNNAVENDVLITVKGSGVGELWYLFLPTVAMGRQLMAIRAIDCSSEFIYQFLMTKKGRFKALGSGNLIPGLSRGDVLDMVLRIPSDKEQQKIADCLSSIDDLIIAQAQEIESLKAHKKGLMQRLFPASDEVSS